MTSITSHYTYIGNSFLKDADVVICNLEAPVINWSDFHGQPFEGNPEVIGLLNKLNVSVVSLANNHILDHGQEGLDNTVRWLSSNGFDHLGLREGISSRIVRRNIRGKKIALAAFNAIHDQPDEGLIAPLEWKCLKATLDEIKKDLPDYIIFSLHWGHEYVTIPSPEQVEMAHELIGSGVSVIIGHHPHVVQPVEKYNGGIILYSIGNYLFDMFWSERVRNGFQADLLLLDDKTTDIQLKPFRISSDFIPDYTRTKYISSELAAAEKSLSLVRSGSRDEYWSFYLKEKRRKRFYARISMKLYLVRNVFRLSRSSRRLFIDKILVKAIGIWKRS